MVHVSKLALSITLLLSVPCLGMNQQYTKAANQEQEFYKKSYENYWKTTGMLSKDEYNRYMDSLDQLKKKPFTHSEENSYSDCTRSANHYIEERMIKNGDAKRDILGNIILIQPQEVKQPYSNLIKVPQPKHITLISKEVARDKIAAFQAMMNTNPSIVVVKDLETLKNPDIKKIREVGNYTMFGDSFNHKWVVDNETGNDLAFSQEMIEKVMQLSTGDIEFMLKNDAFNEQSIDNILESMNKKQ